VEVVVQLGLFVAVLVIGLTFGRANERRHFRELAVLEQSLSDIVVCNGRGPVDGGAFRSSALVAGSVVIAEDYFKRVAAGLKSLVGGRLIAYETLLERGRREAIVRMKEQARRLGATHVVNVRLETASLSEDWSGSRASASAASPIRTFAFIPPDPTSSRLPRSSRRSATRWPGRCA
jgi:uncharacterized protein YbjQ (UPF0145 family)